MEEFNVNTPEGLKRFLLAEAELDDDLYAEEALHGFLQDNKLEDSEYYLMVNCLMFTEA